MSQVLGAVYSGKDSNVVLSSPLTGTITIAGVAAQGLESITITMLQDRTNLKVGMDGAVIISSMPGDQASIAIRVWQVSPLHLALLDWYNALISAQALGDVSNWAASTLTVVNTVNPVGHYCTGVCPVKLPVQLYGMEAQTYEWTLLAANAISQ